MKTRLYVQLFNVAALREKTEANQIKFMKVRNKF